MRRFAAQLDLKANLKVYAAVMAVEIRIGQLAQQAEISRPTIRYYEEEGLLTPARRTSAGYRVYDAEAPARLRFIQRAKALGLSLKEIKLLVSCRTRALLRPVLSLPPRRLVTPCST